MQQSTYYEHLGLAQGASPEQIRKAYLAMVMKITALEQESPDAQEQFFRLRHAFDVLADPLRRSRYDAKLRDRHLQSLVQMASLPDGTEAFARALQPSTDLRPVYGDPIQVALNIYHLPWREYFTYPLPIRLRKLLVTIAFRLLYAGMGALVGFTIMMLFWDETPMSFRGSGGPDENTAYALYLTVYRNAWLALALLFLVFGRVFFLRLLCKWYRFPKDS